MRSPVAATARSFSKILHLLLAATCVVIPASAQKPPAATNRSAAAPPATDAEPPDDESRGPSTWMLYANAGITPWAGAPWGAQLMTAPVDWFHVGVAFWHAYARDDAHGLIHIRHTALDARVDGSISM